MMMLAGCAASTPVVVATTKPTLPAAPAQFGEPVKPPSIKAGVDARALAARERAALIEADRRLKNDKAFYQEVYTNY